MEAALPTSDMSSPVGETVSQEFSSVAKVAHRLCTMLYGTKERSNRTLAITFAMLIGGIALMQIAANAACAVGG